MATKSYIRARVEGETNTPAGKRELEEQVKVLEEVGRVLEQRGYRPGKEEVAKNDDLGTQVTTKSWAK